MSPTTREVEAGRVERMRRQAAAKAAAEQAAPKPRNRAERLEAEHKAATAPNRWTCRLDGCPDAGRWTAEPTRELAVAAGHQHYMTRHYQPDPPYALRGLSASD